MTIQQHEEAKRRYKAINATQEEIDEASLKAIEYIVLGYTLLNAADIILRKSKDLFADIKPNLRYEDKFEVGQNIKDIERVIRRFDLRSQFFDTDLMNLDVGSYDNMRNNANEALRFVMMLYDRTIGDKKATKQLDAYLHRMKSKGIFTVEEISNFRMR